jgi:hypothetical protein
MALSWAEIAPIGVRAVAAGPCFVANAIHSQPPCGFTIVTANPDVFVLNLAEPDRALYIGGHNVEFDQRF